ncbi:unnamed protein product [Sphenostylis stenocarpa]|uniref:Uncharacterized protein n=1 Tax=Sphenostylis stenocarpa TaxID=92480 RepID=A0AA86SBJ4_9FABA|nr:unnamed protein product [Sphenostylis stenocarpa]
MSWEGAAKWVVGINGKKDDSSSHRPGIVGVHEKYDTKKRCNTRTSREVTHPSTTLAQARLAAEFDGIRCISLGMIAPAKCCAINGYMDSTDTD